MDERAVQLRVGLMVLASLGVAVILVAMLGEMPRMLRGTYTISITFPRAPAVTKDTPVRKSGILIGRVSEVRFADAGGVIVTARINDDVELRHNEVCRIKGSLLGDAVLQFVPCGDEDAPQTVIRAGEELAGLVVADPLEVIANLEGNFARAIGSVAETSDELGRFIRRVDHLLESNEQRVNRIIVQSDETLKELKTALRNANELVSDPEVRAQLREAIATVPQILAEAQQTVRRMNDTIAVMEENLRDVQGLTRPLGQRGAILVERIDQGTAKLDTLLGEIVQLTKTLNSRQGSLGQLLNNPDLYQRLNRAAMNVEEISRDLRPVVRDARIFTDKIARNPAVLGVRGALEKRPGLKDSPIQRSRTRRMNCQTQLDSPNHVFYEDWPEPSEPMLR